MNLIFKWLWDAAKRHDRIEPRGRSHIMQNTVTTACVIIASLFGVLSSTAMVYSVPTDGSLTDALNAAKTDDITIQLDAGEYRLNGVYDVRALRLTGMADDPGSTVITGPFRIEINGDINLSNLTLTDCVSLGGDNRTVFWVPAGRERLQTPHYRRQPNAEQSEPRRVELPSGVLALSPGIEISLSNLDVHMRNRVLDVNVCKYRFLDVHKENMIRSFTLSDCTFSDIAPENALISLIRIQARIEDAMITRNNVRNIGSLKNSTRVVELVATNGNERVVIAGNTVRKIRGRTCAETQAFIVRGSYVRIVDNTILEVTPSVYWPPTEDKLTVTVTPPPVRLGNSQWVLESLWVARPPRMKEDGSLILDDNGNPKYANEHMPFLELRWTHGAQGPLEYNSLRALHPPTRITFGTGGCTEDDWTLGYLVSRITQLGFSADISHNGYDSLDVRALLSADEMAGNAYRQDDGTYLLPAANSPRNRADHEAIYVKGSYVVIEGNTIHNGGIGTAYIAAKEPITTDYLLVTNNILTGTDGGLAIWPDKDHNSAAHTGNVTWIVDETSGECQQ
jgi:hypothetical protein